jgi:hypothetical protein
MKTCKECRWWGKPKEGAISAPCSNNKMDSVGGDQAFVVIGRLYTGPDFGCIHWQAQEGYVPHIKLCGPGHPDYGVREASAPCTVEWPVDQLADEANDAGG